MPLARQHIAISGFGVAGALAATLLSRAGHDVHVFERTPQLAPVGAGLLLQPAGQAVLARANLLSPILRSADPILAVRAYTHTRRTLIHLPYPTRAHPHAPPGVFPHALGVHRADLFATLHAAALAAGATLHLDTPIASASQSDTSITLTDTRGQTHGPFDACLAADGTRSTLRSHVSNPSSAERPSRRFASSRNETPTPYPYGAAWTVAPCTSVKNHLLQVTHGTRHLAGLLPTGAGRCSLFWGIPTREFPGSPSAPTFDQLKRQILSLLPEAEEIFQHVTSLFHFTFTTYANAWLPRWHAGRLGLLGDAAHPSSPHLGQGVNLALLDAESLAHSLSTSDDWPTAFSRYQRARRPAQRYYSTLTHHLTPFFQSDGHVRGILRNTFLPLFPHLPLVRSLMLQTLTGPIWPPNCQ